MASELDLNYWLDYIGADQQRLHEVLVAMAKDNSIAMFEQVWRTCRSRHRDKRLNGKARAEHRSLVEAFREAYRAGHHESAVKIWKLDEGWVSGRDPSLEIDEVTSLVEQEMVVSLLSEEVFFSRFKTDISGSINHLQEHIDRGAGKFASLVSLIPEVDTICSIIDKYSENPLFTLTGKRGLLTELLTKGRVTELEVLMERYQVSDSFDRWYLLLESPRADSYEIMLNKYNNKPPMEELLHVEAIGHRRALEWYIGVMTTFVAENRSSAILPFKDTREVYRNILISSFRCITSEVYLELMERANVPLIQIYGSMDELLRAGYDDLASDVLDEVMNSCIRRGVGEVMEDDAELFSEAITKKYTTLDGFII